MLAPALRLLLKESVTMGEDIMDLAESDRIHPSSQPCLKYVTIRYNAYGFLCLLIMVSAFFCIEFVNLATSRFHLT